MSGKAPPRGPRASHPCDLERDVAARTLLETDVRHCTEGGAPDRIVGMPRGTPGIMSPFHVEDFFNLDLLSATANPDAASSRSPSQSHCPTNSLAHLPPMPPQLDLAANFDICGLSAIDEDGMFDFGAGGPYDGLVGATDFLKPGTDSFAGLSHVPHDLFSGFDSGLDGVDPSAPSRSHPQPSRSTTTASATTTAPISSSSGNSASRSPAFQFAIGPQLVGTSAPCRSTSHGPPRGGGARRHGMQRRRGPRGDPSVLVKNEMSKQKRWCGVGMTNKKASESEHKSRRWRDHVSGKTLRTLSNAGGPRLLPVRVAEAHKQK
ncbi:hypothetical protein DFH11DRAFT_1746563 [Phellopilus nigrolimitatus]|nr:hypothetical protein DFH11DRAFT_1746563 [Phellopilus nigrolimitatus]